MMNQDDMALVREFAASQSEPAFAALVQRHIGLVHSAAMRRVGDAHLAEEITQAVFILLARKALTLGPQTILPGWLYRTTGYVAADALKTRRRREQREQEAFMQSNLNEPETPVWRDVAPLLESAMDALNDRDRDVVLLRFFQDKSLAEVAAATGVSEDAARVRVNRALEKLHGYFAKRGISSTTAILAGAIANHSVAVVPAALTKTVTAAALAKGATASASTLTLIKGALKIMAWTKAKTAVVVGVVALFAATSTTVIWIKTHPAPPVTGAPSAALSPLVISVTADMKADGSLHAQAAVVETNRTSQVIRAENMDGEKGDIIGITDELGRPMKYKRTGQYNYLITLDHPVPPGGQVSYSVEENLTAKQLEAMNLVKTTAPDIHELKTTSYPGNDRDVRYVWVLRLPSGARLLDKDGGMTAVTNAGQIELRLDKIIPPNGSYTIGCRYRLPADAH